MPLEWLEVHKHQLVCLQALCFSPLKRIFGCRCPEAYQALISQSIAVLIYNALIQPHFDYYSPIWDGLSNQLSYKLQTLQNHLARVILKANYETSSSLLLETLKWDKLVVRRIKQKAIMMFKSSVLAEPIQRTMHRL